jgi:hypothetical protein
VLMDLLWSDPTTNDGVQGVQPSPRGPGLVTFGPDRVKDFCKVRGWLGGGLDGLHSAASACTVAVGVQLACPCMHALGMCRLLPPLVLPTSPLCLHCLCCRSTDQQPADDRARARVRDGRL